MDAGPSIFIQEVLNSQLQVQFHSVLEISWMIKLIPCNIMHQFLSISSFPDELVKNVL